MATNKGGRICYAPTPLSHHREFGWENRLINQFRRRLCRHNWHSFLPSSLSVATWPETERGETTELWGGIKGAFPRSPVLLHDRTKLCFSSPKCRNNAMFCGLTSLSGRPPPDDSGRAITRLCAARRPLPSPLWRHGTWGGIWTDLAYTITFTNIALNLISISFFWVPCHYLLGIAAYQVPLRLNSNVPVYYHGMAAWLWVISHFLCMLSLSLSLCA